MKTCATIIATLAAVAVALYFVVEAVAHALVNALFH